MLSRAIPTNVLSQRNRTTNRVLQSKKSKLFRTKRHGILGNKNVSDRLRKYSKLKLQNS